jgi:hypothetical protein
MSFLKYEDREIMIRYASVLMLLLAVPGWADTYKWTDEDGKIHYSDQPPPNTIQKSETIKQQKAAPAAAPTGAPPPPEAAPKPGVAPKTPTDQDMEFRKRRLQQAEADAKAQKEAQAAEEKKRNCQRATEQMQAFERGGRITRYGPNGEQQFMNEQEVQAELANARKAADSWCK